MTPGEFNELVEGWKWRHYHNEDMAAQWVCAILNGVGHLKQKITPAELLGRPLGPLLPIPKG